MIALVLILALLAAVGIVATVRIVRVDGLRRIPTRRDGALAGGTGSNAYDPAT